MTVCTGAPVAVFGPRVIIACRAFDFTPYFEDVFLVCLPVTLFLLLFPIELWLLRTSTAKFSDRRY